MREYYFLHGAPAQDEPCIRCDIPGQDQRRITSVYSYLRTNDGRGEFKTGQKNLERVATFFGVVGQLPGNTSSHAVDAHVAIRMPRLGALQLFDQVDRLVSSRYKRAEMGSLHELLLLCMRSANAAALLYIYIMIIEI